MPPQKPLPFTTLSRLGKAKAKEFTIQGLFQYGYRNKEDISNLPPQTLVVGSQNVLTNAAELVGIRQGYVLDGTAGNQNTYGIDSAYDFQGRDGIIQNLRKWGSNLEVRYLNPHTNAVSWINIFSSLVAGNVANFTNFWDATTEQKMFCLFCNGTPSVYEWSGGVASFASASNASGIIGGITANPNLTVNTSGGVNYAVGDVLTISGGNGDARLTVGSITPGGVGTISIQGVGAGSYSANDIIKITGAGAQAAFAKVTTVDGGGHVTGISLLTAGAGYYVASAVSTTNVTNGAATGLTLNILTIGNTITSWILTAAGTGYSAANNIGTSGGSGTAATVQINSVATNSITVSGSKTLSQLGFYDNSNNSGKFQLLINGVVYTYTGSNANGGYTFIGINVDPTIQGFAVGDAIIQVPVTGAIAGSNASFIQSGFSVSLISTLKNQIWYGSLTNANVYVSATNNYQSTAFSTPSRLPAEGALIVLDSPPVGFYPQAGDMYASAGKDQWWLSLFNQQTISVANVATPTETLSMQRLKTAFNQGAQSQGLIGQYKNSLVYVSNEQIINALGLVKDILADPQVTNMSDPIKFDIDAYNFAGGQVLYDNYYIYVTIPSVSVVRMYNVVKQYWEAPQILPISRFYHLTSTQGSVIYGHSSLTNESYQMFTGYNDNGNPITAVAAFPYLSTSGGSANEKKNFNKVFTEGYISGNTQLTLTANYDFGGYSGTYSTIINGNNLSPPNIIFNKVTDGSIGQNSLGSQPIGQILNLNPQSTNPKFRVINTMPRVNMFEYQLVYSSNDVDFQWAILRFGPAVTSASEIGVEITA